MHPWKLRADAPATARSLDTATLKRIQWLFDRVCRHGYGAEPSLKCAVQAGAARMVEAGATRSAIRHAIATSVQGDFSEDLSRTTFVAMESRVVSIRRRMMGWADAALATDAPPVIS